MLWVEHSCTRVRRRLFERFEVLWCGASVDAVVKVKVLSCTVAIALFFHSLCTGFILGPVLDALGLAALLYRRLHIYRVFVRHSGLAFQANAWR